MENGARIAVLTTVLFLFKAAFSGECPNLSAIQSGGINNVAAITDQIYAGYKYGTFNTDTQWTFIIGFYVNMSEQEALLNVNGTLGEMSSSGDSTTYPNATLCTYATGQPEIFSLAINNVSQISPKQIEQYLHYVQ